MEEPVRLTNPIRRCARCRYPINGDGFRDEGKLYCSRSCREIAALDAINRGAAQFRLPSIVVIVAWAIAFALVWATGPNKARAHDPYMHLKQPDNGASCCNGMDKPNGDCAPSRAYMHEDGLWRAYDVKDGQWYAVPHNKVLKMKSWDGRTHYCGVRGTSYCLIVGDTLY